MRPWWVRWPELRARELDAFAQLGLPARVDPGEEAAGRLARLVVHSGVVIDGEETDVTVVYPDTFPHTPPDVYVPNASLRRHYDPTTGHLCLLGDDPEQWDATMRAADLVAGVPELSRLVREGGPELVAAEEAEGDAASRYYEAVPWGGVVVPGPALEVPPDVGGGSFSLACRRGLEDWLLTGGGFLIPFGQVLLATASDDAGAFAAEADFRLASGFRGSRMEGRWLRCAPGAVPEPAPAAELYNRLADIDPRIDEAPLHPDGQGGGFRAVAFVFDEEVRYQEHEPVWMFVLRYEACEATMAGEATVTDATILRGLRYSEADLGARIPELAPLRARRVAQVGLGSLGAPLAFEFARAQVGRLRIADSRALDAGASVRWPDGLPAAGMSKTLYVSSKVRDHHPLVGVEVIPLYVGAGPLERHDSSEAGRLDRLVDGADLLVDATANDNVNRALDDVARQAGVPFLCVYGVDGFGGVVARIRPGRTGCFHCLSLHLANGAITPPPAAETPRRVEPRGCAAPTFTAPAPDLAPLVDMAARVAFSTLCEGEPGGYPPLDDDVFVLALRRPDGTLEPVPVWRSFSLTPHAECPRCTPR